MQVAVNYANDYFDGVRGVDTAQRVGPRRAVASGLVAPARMRAAIGVALGVAGVAGLALAAAAGWELLAVGAACFAAALAYSGGPRPYASAGLGELFVFVFFGLVATVGSAYVQAERVVAVAVAAAVPIGCLATAILAVNNLRDIETDRVAGKLTLAVRQGDRATRLQVAVLVGWALGPLTLLVAYVERSGWPMLGLLALPWAAPALRPVSGRRERGRALIPALAATARLELVFAVLLSAGLLLA